MESTTVTLLVIDSILSILLIGCFIWLCINVFTIKKSHLTLLQEYEACRLMNDNKKAYDALVRYYIMRSSSRKEKEEEKHEFYFRFKELGLGFPKGEGFEMFEN